MPVGTSRPRYTVIGVVADAKYRNLREPFLPTAYSDMEQTPADDAQPHLVVRSSLPVAALTDALTRAVADVSPRVSVRYRTLQSVIDQALSRERVTAILCAVFGGLAILIAAVGLYGVMSYVVAQRRVEIGVRMALGADRTTVMRLIVREAAVLLTAGLVLGLSLAIPAGRAASALLYGVQSSDPSTIAIAMGSLTLVSLVATWLPARRASSLEPTIALRTE
jgi:ABC-type lipoprotein release transport system permease subunit